MIYGRNKTNDNTRGRSFPLVCDFNPGLPNIGRIINKYKHILDLDEDLQKIIPRGSIFTSFRRAPTIRDKLIHSKLRSLPASLNTSASNLIGGCYPCPNKCHLCKNHLTTGDTFQSYHCNRTFKIKDNINCTTQCVIYLINCKICQKSNVGCTTNSMNTRWANHRSHMKYNRRTCELVNHVIDNSDKH